MFARPLAAPRRFAPLAAVLSVAFAFALALTVLVSALGTAHALVTQRPAGAPGDGPAHAALEAPGLPPPGLVLHADAARSLPSGG